MLSFNLHLQVKEHINISFIKEKKLTQQAGCDTSLKGPSTNKETKRYTRKQNYDTLMLIFPSHVLTPDEARSRSFMRSGKSSLS